jgi:hypothetical protein
MCIGDHYHQIVLENKDAIMKMFKHVTQIPSLDKIEDSIRLGNIFVENGLMKCLGRDHRVPDEAKRKYPKHLLPMNPAN